MIHFIYNNYFSMKFGCFQNTKSSPKVTVEDIGVLN